MYMDEETSTEHSRMHDMDMHMEEETPMEHRVMHDMDMDEETPTEHCGWISYTPGTSREPGGPSYSNVIPAEMPGMPSSDDSIPPTTLPKHFLETAGGKAARALSRVLGWRAGPGRGPQKKNSDVRPSPSYVSPGMPSTNNENWINKVSKRVNSARPVDQHRNPCTIFKVPSYMRSLDTRAYDPVVAFFGPFHQKDPFESSVMQEHKWRCVRYLLSRHGSQEDAKQLLEKCLLKLKDQDGKVRSCYSEQIHPALGDQDLASMMLLDGCFIIYLMLNIRAGKELSTKEQTKMEKGMEKEDAEGKWKDETNKEDEGKKRERTTQVRHGEVVLDIKENEKLPDDPTVEGLFTLDLVVHDLLKLENQIPFFIIQLLFDHLKTSDEDGEFHLVDLALQLFMDIHPKQSELFKKKSPREYHHLLHLFYSSRILSENPAKEVASAPGCISHAIGCIKSRWKKVKAAPSQGSAQGTLTSAPKWIPSATELDKAGVKFKRKKLPIGSFLNITFERTKMKIMPLRCLLKLCFMFRGEPMEIPPLQIYDYTRPLFRNLIAFEQCYFHTEMYITVYMLFMDCIINQAEDVRLLHLKGILEHVLSNDQAVADLFNDLGTEIRFTWKKNYLTNQIKKVNEFYDSKWHKWLAGLRRDYLGNPWSIISVLGAIFLLMLTFEQSLFSALSYFHHSS